MKKVLTLCVVHTAGQILLGMKKKGFGAGRWNGFGGKVEAGETIEAAAKRETFEEVGLVAEQLDPFGVLEFSFQQNNETLEVHVFRVLAYRGQPQESDEMAPRWFSLDQIPFDEMWADDRHWLPLLLAGKKFRGSFRFSKFDKLLEAFLEEAQSQNQH